MATVGEQILAMLREQSPRTNRDFAVAIYGDGSINSKVKVGQRLKDLVRRGVIREERTGPEQNALVLYHLESAPQLAVDEQLRRIQEALEGVAGQIAALRLTLSNSLQQPLA